MTKHLNIVFIVYVHSLWFMGWFLKRAEHGANVTGGVIIHHGKDDGVHECDHVLGSVGRDAQQHVGAEHVEQKDEVNEAGEVKHCVDGYNIRQ